MARFFIDPAQIKQEAVALALFIGYTDASLGIAGAVGRSSGQQDRRHKVESLPPPETTLLH